MFALKPLAPEALPRALEKAMRYRLLSEPEEAESICLDVLTIEPNHQQALVTLLLSLTDQFVKNCADCFSRAKELVPLLESEYERSYYSGIIYERRGNAILEHGSPGSEASAFSWFEKAMACYEQAEAQRPPQNDDAILRWNTCARVIMRHHLQPRSESFEPITQE